jgi:hypothetical protein
MQLVGNLRSSFPQFAQTGQNGAFMQQDAEEFLNILTQSIVESLASLTSSVNPEFNRLLGINLEEQQICQETDLEPVINKTEKANKIVCNIQNAQLTGADLIASTSAVDHLHDGVKLGEMRYVTVYTVAIIYRTTLKQLTVVSFQRRNFPHTHYSLKVF